MFGDLQPAGTASNERTADSMSATAACRAFHSIMLVQLPMPLADEGRRGGNRTRSCWGIRLVV
jgi:hypothetical protein